MLDDSHKSLPDVKHWVVVERYSSKERIVTEQQLKSAFGEKRWYKITSGTDDYFTAYEYNYEYTSRGFKL
jgi:hypothetical protein